MSANSVTRLILESERNAENGARQNNTSVKVKYSQTNRNKKKHKKISKSNVHQK